MIVGKYGKLSNTVFEGDFSSGAAHGDLVLKDGTTISGEMRYTQTRGFAEHGIKFYTDKQIEEGADKSIIIYQMPGEEKYHQKEFNKMKDANEFYKSISVSEGTCTAKVHLHDLNIVSDAQG